MESSAFSLGSPCETDFGEGLIRSCYLSALWSPNLLKGYSLVPKSTVNFVKRNLIVPIGLKPFYISAGQLNTSLKRFWRGGRRRCKLICHVCCHALRNEVEEEASSVSRLKVHSCIVGLCGTRGRFMFAFAASGACRFCSCIGALPTRPVFA